jgi:hypothetical protein
MSIRLFNVLDRGGGGGLVIGICEALLSHFKRSHLSTCPNFKEFLCDVFTAEVMRADF